jgi:hypothetical protein
MNIDPGLVIVIVAVLVFYLRLIIQQRQRAKQPETKPAARSKKRGKDRPVVDPGGYRLLSSNPRDLLIAGVGALAILVGILLYIDLLPFQTLQTYWWIPTALGIIAFSWAFNGVGAG